MNEQRTQRKLTAILAADVVGFSKMMGEDEERTLGVLKTCRGIIDATIAEYGGTIFNTAGDAVIAEFASPVEAVRCAVDFQRALRQRNEHAPPETRMVFRCGVNLGDVIIEGDNLFGDGVNIAARLESIAAPGGICVSGTVYDHIKNKISLAFGDLGEQALKNIVEPVPVYQVNLDAEADAAGLGAAGGAKGQPSAAPVVIRPARRFSPRRLALSLLVLPIFFLLIAQVPLLWIPEGGVRAWGNTGTSPHRAVNVRNRTPFSIAYVHSVTPVAGQGYKTTVDQLRLGWAWYEWARVEPRDADLTQPVVWRASLLPKPGIGKAE